MPKLVDLHDYRTKVVEQKVFGPWQKRFGETYHLETRLSDLSDRTIYFLAQPGEKSAIAYYEFIMGVLDLGPATKFNYLPSEQQMQVVDIHLFLADQVRSEMMRRLEWLQALPCQNCTIVTMVRTYEQMRNTCRQNPPGLAPSHPGSQAFEQLSNRDKEIFIRKLLREALEKFETQLK
jgi:hypothetical protein